jgi:hypothetical protein
MEAVMVTMGEYQWKPLNAHGCPGRLLTMVYWLESFLLPAEVYGNSGIKVLGIIIFSLNTKVSALIVCNSHFPTTAGQRPITRLR